MSLTKLSATIKLSILILFLFSTNVFSKELIIGVGFALAPYVIDKPESGIEIDILKTIFKQKKHSIRFKYSPNTRMYLDFKNKKIDGAINVKQGLFKLGYYTDDVVTFQDFAISLDKNKFNINNINDLKNKRVIAFQSASILLGDEFSKMASQNKYYKELADQSVHSMMLYHNRVDVIVSDKKIFLYYLRKLKSQDKLFKHQFKQSIKFHPIFPLIAYPFVFRSKKVRDEFNEGLREIRKNGTYDKILNNYK